MASHSRNKQHVFLVPGFLGIGHIGDVVYFAHVKEFLQPSLEELGLEAELHLTQTYATASLRARARRLLDIVAETCGGDDAPIHLIGHSSGGLDARLLCTPNVSLDTPHDVEAYAQRVRSVIGVSVPNRGTPLASFFSTLLGQQILKLLSLGTIYVLRFGRLPMSVVFKLSALFVRLHGQLGWLRHNIADQIFTQLLGDFSQERRDELSQIFRDMADDQALIPQLMPESTDALDAVIADRPGVRYGCVVSMAEASARRALLRIGFDPYAQATHAMFYALYQLTEDMPQRYAPALRADQAAALLRAYGRMPGPKDNDGVVPTLSQVEGEVIHAVEADHLDVIGHFGDAKHTPPHYDWLASSKSFKRAQFERLWTRVAETVANTRGS